MSCLFLSPPPRKEKGKALASYLFLFGRGCHCFLLSLVFFSYLSPPHDCSPFLNDFRFSFASFVAT